MKEKIEKDIWDWIKNYVEVNHEFYNYKFPPCPYAKSARIKNLVSVSAYTAGNYFSFLNDQVKNLDNRTIKVLVFPRKFRWYYHLHFYMKHLNKTLSLRDRFLQYGSAVTTESQYPGIKGPYFIAIINVLSDVTAGHTQLLDTDYYKFWDSKHYSDVVERRNKLINHDR